MSLKKNPPDVIPRHVTNAAKRLTDSLWTVWHVEYAGGGYLQNVLDGSVAR